MGVVLPQAQKEISNQTIAKSPEKVQKTGDSTSPNLMTMRTLETEENTPVITQEQTIRTTRADDKEFKERKRSNTPSRRRIPQLTTL